MNIISKLGGGKLIKREFDCIQMCSAGRGFFHKRNTVNVKCAHQRFLYTSLKADRHGLKDKTNLCWLLFCISFNIRSQKTSSFVKSLLFTPLLETWWLHLNGINTAGSEATVMLMWDDWLVKVQCASLAQKPEQILWWKADAQGRGQTSARYHREANQLYQATGRQINAEATYSRS